MDIKKLTQIAAVAILVMMFLGAGIVAVWQFITLGAPSAPIMAVLTTGGLWSASLLGLERGVQLTNGDTAAALKQLPQVLAALQAQPTAAAPAPVAAPPMTVTTTTTTAPVAVPVVTPLAAPDQPTMPLQAVPHA